MNCYLVKGEALAAGDKKQKRICLAIGLFLPFLLLTPAIESIVNLLFRMKFKSGTYVVYSTYGLLTTYGVALGGALIVWLRRHVKRGAFAISKAPTEAGLLHSLIPSGFMRLTFSGSSLLKEPNFWFLIGSTSIACNSENAKSSERQEKYVS